MKSIKVYDCGREAEIRVKNSAKILMRDVGLSFDKIRDFLLNKGIELTRGEK